MFLPLAIGMIEVGLVLWTRNALQTAAELAARCAAIGPPGCPDPLAFAVSATQSWTISAITPNVTVSTSDGCNGAPGGYKSVTVSSDFWAGLPGFFPAASLSATACYPA